MKRSALRPPRKRVTDCVVCGRPLIETLQMTPQGRPRGGGRIYCSYECSRKAEMDRRPSLPRTDYTKALRADPCAYCGKRVKSTCLDHIDALGKGGTNDEMNLTASCRSCNASKNDDPLLTFMLWRLNRDLPLPQPTKSL